MICPELGCSNPKRFWSFIKSKRCDNNGVAPLTVNGISHVDEKTKADILNRQFASVFSQDDGVVPHLGQPCCPRMENITIKQNGIRKLLRDLKPHKASGPDHIQSRFLKETADELAPAMCTLFQASLSQGHIPNEWRHANVAPVFKKGDRSRASNYRPVSLTSICCKTMEHIMHSNILSHLEKHGILTDYQHGFRKRRSTETQLILTIQDLAKDLDEGKQIDAILLDFSKAFDKVSHRKLLAKLRHYGIDGPILAWVSDFLTDRTQTVVLNGRESDKAEVVSGVPQGTVLGPLLFLAYINDLPDGLGATPRLFADDCILYRIIDSVSDATSLQQDLDHLQLWEARWSMEFNPDKCEVLRVTNKRRPILATYNIHGRSLNQVDTAKYLGVKLHSKLQWKPHIDMISKKANSTRAFLQRNLHGCQQQVKARCYTTYIRPTLEYAGAAWDPHTTGNKTIVERLEAVQKRCARFVTGDWRRTSSISQMLTALNWQSLQERRAHMRLHMLHNIIHGAVDIPAMAYLTPMSHSYDTRGAHIKYHLPHARLNVYKNSFFPACISMWNRLPSSVSEATSAEVFRGRLAAVVLTH